MEVSEGTTPAHQSDMGIPHTDEVPAMCSAGRNSLITVEGSEHICRRDAKVRDPLPPETYLHEPVADDCDNVADFTAGDLQNRQCR